MGTHPAVIYLAFVSSSSMYASIRKIGFRVGRRVSKLVAGKKVSRRRASPASSSKFAPYFPVDEPSKFACVHKVFGASKVSKMLQPWLRFPFYEEKCSKHVRKYNTVFCTVCMGEPVCEVCWKEESEHHQGHQFLQVYRASQRSAVWIECIKELWDVSAIQPYKINSKNIVHLHPNTFGGAGDQNQNHPFCQTCKRKIKELNYNFCSVACKHESITMEMEETSPIRESHDEAQPANIKRKRADYCATSLRKRSRKGTPQRAPLK